MKFSRFGHFSVVRVSLEAAQNKCIIKVNTPNKSHDTGQRLSQVDPKGAAISHCQKSRGHQETKFQDTLPLFKCEQSVPLCHYQIGHTYFTEEMKVFFLLQTSAVLCPVEMTSETWPEESDYHHSVRTLLSCDHMLVWKFVPMSACFWKGKGQNCWALVFMYLSGNVCTDIWPNRHANTPKISEKGSVSGVKVSNTAYRTTSLSSCHPSDVKKKTSFCPEHLHENTVGPSFCQVVTNSTMKALRAKLS